MIAVRRLFISPGHSFYGRHGQPPGDSPIVEVDEVECIAGRGLRGDRFFDYKPDYKGQITFFSAEVYAAVCRALNVAPTNPGSLRRNVVVSGVDLNQLIGCEFEIQGVRFAGAEECRPCHWMNTAVGAGAEERLKGHGGLRARILTSGFLRRSSE